MDNRQKVRDLIRKAIDDRTNYNERVSCAFQAIGIIDRYGLLDSEGSASSKGNGVVDVVAKVVSKVTDPDFVEQVASRAERFASGVERVNETIGKVARTRSDGRKRRRYSR